MGLLTARAEARESALGSGLMPPPMVSAVMEERKADGSDGNILEVEGESFSITPVGNVMNLASRASLREGCYEPFSDVRDYYG